MPFLQMSNESPSKAPWHLLIGATLAMLMLIAISIGAPRPASAETGKVAGDGCAACVLTAERTAADVRKPGDQVKRLNRKVKRAVMRAKRKERRDRVRSDAAEKREAVKDERKKRRVKAKLTSAQIAAKRREKVARIREARRARRQEFRRDWNNLAPKEE